MRRYTERFSQNKHKCVLIIGFVNKDAFIIFFYPNWQGVCLFGITDGLPLNLYYLIAHVVRHSQTEKSVVFNITCVYQISVVHPVGLIIMQNLEHAFWAKFLGKTLQSHVSLGERKENLLSDTILINKPTRTLKLTHNIDIQVLLVFEVRQNLRILLKTVFQTVCEVEWLVFVINNIILIRYGYIKLFKLIFFWLMLVHYFQLLIHFHLLFVLIFAQ